MCTVLRIGSKGGNLIYGSSSKNPPRIVHALFPFMECDYFDNKVKISSNKTAKYYGVIFMCLKTKAVHRK